MVLLIGERRTCFKGEVTVEKTRGKPDLSQYAHVIYCFPQLKLIFFLFFLNIDCGYTLVLIINVLEQK